MSDAKDKTVLAFDVYGTLLSTESIAKKLSSHFGSEKAQTIATTWRKYQLEYTWRLNSMGQYEDFSKVTRNSLKHALTEASVSLAENDIEEMMQAYDSLSTFPDVTATLTAISKHENLFPVVFSNGTHDMVSNSIHKSADLSPHATVFKDIVVVEKVRKYKPAPELYAHLATKVGKNPEDKRDMGAMWLISGNPFDIVGARAVGMKACWVDRAGNGWQDALVSGEDGKPTAIVNSLEDVVSVVTKS